MRPRLVSCVGCCGTCGAGDVAAALRVLEEERPRAKNQAVVATLRDYVQARQPYIPNYRERRRSCQYIGSGHIEKANDLLVARRQKGHGMHWSRETSAALAALRTLLLNDGWDLYWQGAPSAPSRRITPDFCARTNLTQSPLMPQK